MAVLRKDSSQPHDYVVAMRNSESLPRILWGALQYDSQPHAYVSVNTANKKSNLHTNCQVKVLPVGLVTLGTRCRPAADIVSILDLCERDEIPSLPDNILPLTLARVVTRTFSDGRTDGRSDDARGGVRDLDAL
jgi:hypothetical protein